MAQNPGQAQFIVFLMIEIIIPFHKLLEARRKRFINVRRERDEEIILLKIPKPFMPASEKWKDPATEEQD